MKKVLMFFTVLLFSFLMFGCLGSEEEETNYLKLTFKLDGVAKEYEVLEDCGFSLATASYYSGLWLGEDEEDVFIYLPSNVTAGNTYYVGDENVNFKITNDVILDSTEATDGFEITVTEWNSEDGGVIKGTFSGSVSDGVTTKSVTEGSFESRYRPTGCI